MDAEKALTSMMTSFGQEHWHEVFDPAQAQLQIEGDVLRCTVQGETVEGHADAPLMFVSAAWALIFAYQSDGRYGHRVDGRINRVWPNGVDANPANPMLGEQFPAFAAHWPQLCFNRVLYPDLDRPDQKIHLSAIEDAPSRTSLSGILKRAALAAADADPVQRLRCAEFLYKTLRWDWSSTSSDLIMAGIGKALHRLLLDEVPSVREMALILADYVAFMLWCRRAYDHYPALCRSLIDAGLNAHMQHARLAEAAFARGDLDAGEQHWALAVEGQNPLRAQRLSQAYDHIGDWNDLRARIYRQAAEAHLRYAAGSDPDDARQRKLMKKGLVAPSAATQKQHRAHARELLRRAIALAETRVATDVAAIEQGGEVPIGQQTIDPLGRRLYLDEFFWLQSQLEDIEGDHEAALAWLIRAVDVDWRMRGALEHYEGYYLDVVLQAAEAREKEELADLGWPEVLWPAWEARQKDRALGDGPDAQEHRFWLDFMKEVQKEFLSENDSNGDPVAVATLGAGFKFERHSEQLWISHEDHDEVAKGPMSAPVLVALQAWGALWQHAFGSRPELDAMYWARVRLHESGVQVLARIAGERLDADDPQTALALWRMAHGTDPLISPWWGNDPVDPLPLEKVPEQWRGEVGRRSSVVQDQKRTKLKPAGRRVEALTALYDENDIVLLRDIGEALRKDVSCWESETVRVMKAAPPLLDKLRRHPHPSIQEMGVIASLGLLVTLSSQYEKGLADENLIGAIQLSGVSIYRW